MIAVLCAVAAGAGFHLSIGLGDQWALAWIAPVPVLWWSFGRTGIGLAFVTAAAAYALGATNLLTAYAGILPPPVVALAILAPAFAFALAVVGARLVYRAFGAYAGALAFGALWAAFDFASSFNPAGGSVMTPAAAEVGMPILAQSASLAGHVGVTFLLGAVSAGLAAGLRERCAAPALVAVLLFAANAGFGFWRMSAPPDGAMRVALVVSDDAVGKFAADDEAAASRVVRAYADRIAQLGEKQVDLIILPENVARIAPEWREKVLEPLAAAAATTRATVIAGFNTAVNGRRQNVAVAFAPGAPPVTYAKRQLVPGLETTVYARGDGPRALPGGILLEICKDMDFHAMIRADVAATAPVLIAAPAWDFRADGWSHARVAILRSIENGVPLARAARDGVLTLSDRYGRIVARAPSQPGFTVLVDDVPLDGRQGRTLHNRLGDVFGWMFLTLGVGLVLAAHLRSRSLGAR